MGLFDFFKQRKLERRLKDAEWEVGTSPARGQADALAQLGKAHYDLGKHEDAANAYDEAAKVASKMPVTKMQERGLKSRADDIRNRFVNTA